MVKIKFRKKPYSYYGFWPLYVDDHKYRNVNGFMINTKWGAVSVIFCRNGHKQYE